MSRRRRTALQAEKMGNTVPNAATSTRPARSLPPRLSLQVLVDELDSLAVDALEKVPESGRAAFVFPLSSLHVEYGNLVKELLRLETIQSAKIYCTVYTMMRAAFLIGHHGPPSPNAAALTRRLGTAKARQTQVDPDKDQAIEAAIDKHVVGWDGSHPTKMSVAISVELETSGSPYRMTPRGIRNRLKRRGFDSGREA